jgi:GDP-L-fucose synthase
MINPNILSDFPDKNCLVTGGSGMIGSEVVRILCNAGSKVKIVSLDDIIVDERAEHIKADLTNISVCKDVTSGMDYVFHIAGIKGSIDVTKSKPASFLVPLLMFNTNVLEASRINGVKKLVYTSSIGVYSSAEVFKEGENLDGVPMDMYPGWAKRMAELQIKAYREQYGLNWAVVRPCNVYGPRDNFDPENAMVIPSLMMRISRGETPVVVWGDGSAVRDFAFSKDVAEGIILAIYHGTRGDFVNLGSGVGVTIKELLETLHCFLHFNYEFDTTKPSGFPKRVMDISRAREWIEYNPTTTLLDGLKETWVWFQKNQKEYLKRKNYFSEDEG